MELLTKDERKLIHKLERKEKGKVISLIVLFLIGAVFVSFSLLRAFNHPESDKYQMAEILNAIFSFYCFSLLINSVLKDSKTLKVIKKLGVGSDQVE